MSEFEKAYKKCTNGLGPISLIRFWIGCGIGNLARLIGGHPYKKWSAQMFVYGLKVFDRPEGSGDESKTDGV